MAETKTFDERVQARVIEELDHVDMYELYDQMLDECSSVDNCPTCQNYGGAEILKRMDPIAYRCGFNDYTDSVRDEYTEIGEDYYKADEIETIREEIQDEDDAAAEEKEESEAASEKSV